MEIDHEIFSMAILLPTDSRRASQVLIIRLVSAAKEKNEVRLTDHLDMTITFDWGVKSKTKQNYYKIFKFCYKNLALQSYWA